MAIIGFPISSYVGPMWASAPHKGSFSGAAAVGRPNPANPALQDSLCPVPAQRTNLFTFSDLAQFGNYLANFGMDLARSHSSPLDPTGTPQHQWAESIEKDESLQIIPAPDCATTIVANLLKGDENCAGPAGACPSCEHCLKLYGVPCCFQYLLSMSILCLTIWC